MPTSDFNARTPPGESIAYPLDEFYARSGNTLPPLDQVEGQAVPEPYRTLLVHDHDMTSTLENFHRAGIHLRLLGRERKGEDYFREVLLLLEGSRRFSRSAIRWATS
jgi:hypothetical protein